MAYPSSSTQVDRPSRTFIQRIAAESALNAGAVSYTDARFIDNSEPTLKQDEVEDLGQSEYLFDDFKTIPGYNSWEDNKKFHVTSPTAQYLAAATPTDDFQSIILKAGMGGEHRAAGSLVEDTPTPADDEFAVTTGTGANFPEGKLILVEKSGQLEETIVSAVATDTLSLAWPLSGAPSDGAKVVNSDCFYLAQTASGSIALRAVHSLDANYQIQALGGMVDSLKFSFDRMNTLQCDAALKGLSHTGPDALGLSTTKVTDAVIKGIHMKGARLFLWPVASPNRTRIPMHSIEFEFSLGNQQIPETGGDNEGVTAIAKGGNRITVTCTLTTRLDRWYRRLLAEKTDLCLCLSVRNPSTGTDVRGVSIVMPGARVVGVPTTAEEDKMQKTRVILRGQASQLLPNATTDLARSPLLINRW